MNTPIVNDAFRFVKKMYREYLPDGADDMQLEVGVELKNNCVLFGREWRLPDEDLEKLALAALLHNIGIVQYQYHQRKISVMIAEHFLKEKGYSPMYIYRVITLIEATADNATPEGRLQILINGLSHAHSFSGKRQLVQQLGEVGDLWP